MNGIGWCGFVGGNASLGGFGVPKANSTLSLFAACGSGCRTPSDYVGLCAVILHTRLKPTKPSGLNLGSLLSTRYFKQFVTFSFGLKLHYQHLSHGDVDRLDSQCGRKAFKGLYMCGFLISLGIHAK